MADRVTRVVKRDGSVEPFDLPRFTDSLAAAVGDDPAVDGLAEQLAAEIYQRLPTTERVVETTTLARLAVLALQQAGQERAARAYVGFRLGLEGAVDRLRIHTRDGEQRRASPWDRARLALSLARDRSLDLNSARKIAGMIERRLVMADLRHVTGRLVTAMTDNECRSLGLRSDPLDQEHIGIDRRQLRAWLGGDCLPGGDGVTLLGPEGGDLRPRLGQELLARFAAEEVLSAPQSRAMAEGVFHLPQLGDWLRPARIRLRPEADESEDSFWHRVRDCRRMTAEVQVFWPTSRPWSRLTLEAPTWWEGSDCRLRLGTGAEDLAGAWAAAGHWVRMPAACFARCDQESRRRLARTNHVELVWQPPRRLPPAEDRSQEVLDGVALINLAGAAMRAEAWQESQFLATVKEGCELACHALQALAVRGRGIEHPRISLMPVGLDRAFSLLYAGGGVGTDRCRRLLHSIRGLFESSARHVGLRLCHAAPPHPGPAGARLAAIDGLSPDQAYRCGWLGLAPQGALDLYLFDAAPWLQFSASVAESDSSWTRRLPTPTDFAGS